MKSNPYFLITPPTLLTPSWAGQAGITALVISSSCVCLSQICAGLQFFRCDCFGRGTSVLMQFWSACSSHRVSFWGCRSSWLPRLTLFWGSFDWFPSTLRLSQALTGWSYLPLSASSLSPSPPGNTPPPSPNDALVLWFLWHWWNLLQRWVGIWKGRGLRRRSGGWWGGSRRVGTGTRCGGLDRDDNTCLEYECKWMWECEFPAFVVVGEFNLELLGKAELHLLHNQNLPHLRLLVLITLPLVHYYNYIPPRTTPK